MDSKTHLSRRVPPTLREVFEHVLEPHEFSVLDVENLRLHYAKTLEHWRQRFNASAHQVAAMFDERFVRAWELYLAGSQAAFSTGLDAIVPGRVRQGRQQRHALDACQRLKLGATAVDTCDVVIVGGGPAGSACAWRLRQAGLEVVVIDKAIFPRDKVCAGWITPQVLDDLRDRSRRLPRRTNVSADHGISCRCDR